MKVIVLGGGVVGVTAAWYLAEHGHEVVVVDRHEAVGRETSYANAGYIAPGHCYAWASPRAPFILLQSLTRADAALRMRLRPDPRLWAWTLKFLANCTTARNRANTLVKLKLCLYSRERLIALREQTGLAYDEELNGALYLHRSQATLDVAAVNAERMRAHGLRIETIDTDRAAEIEPALKDVAREFAGAIYCADDESGDCYVFTQQLMALCEEKGVVLRGGVEVRGLRTDGERIVAAITDDGEISGDTFVLALGSYSPFVARSVGVRLPIYPVKGYSMTIPAADGDGTPRVPVLDEHYLIAFSRFGPRFRMTAAAEFAGYDTGYRPADFAAIHKVARALFPRAGDYEQAEYWACLRPMTPDGPPILGRGRHRNLWYNAGQGHMGWTMACGSSKIIADLVSGRTPDHDLAGMEVSRFSR